MSRLTLNCVIAIAVSVFIWGSVNQEASAIEIVQRDQQFHLTVPESKLELTLPRGFARESSAERGGATASPTYFIFADKARKVVLSGWIEPASRFKGLNTLWEEELAVWPRTLPSPQDVSFSTVADWETISFNLTTQSGSSAYVRAHWNQSGTWIELRLSCYGGRPLAEQHAALLEALRAIQVREKASAPESGTVRRLEAGDRGFLVLKVPAGWMEEIRPSRDPRLPPEISYRPVSGLPFVVMLSFAWPAATKPSLEVVREIVDSRADDVKPKAVEAVVQVKELRGTQANGYYFSATDSAPKPGEYKYMTQGALAVGDIIMTFTLLTNDGQQTVVDHSLEMVRNAVQQPR